jgi:hypothetical protein
MMWPHQHLERFLINRQKRRLTAVVQQAQQQLLSSVRQKCAHATVTSHGLEGVDPSTLGFKLRTATEQQRIELMRDGSYLATLRETLVRLGYPSWAASKIQLHFSSTEEEAEDLDTWGNPR